MCFIIQVSLNTISTPNNSHKPLRTSRWAERFTAGSTNTRNVVACHLTLNVMVILFKKCFYKSCVSHDLCWCATVGHCVFAGELQSKHSWDSDKTRGMVQNTFAIVAKAVIRTLHSRRQGLIDRILIPMKIKGYFFCTSANKHCFLVF